MGTKRTADGAAQPLTGLAAEVRDVVSPLVGAHGLLVESVQITPAGGSRVLRVVVDRDDSALLASADHDTPVPPLSLDDVAEASRGISDALDALVQLGSAPYTLEVTSPGVDRPLTDRRHFRRNVGRLVVLTLVDGVQLEGRLLSVSADELVLKMAPLKGRPADSGPERAVALADVARGRVEVEFNRLDELDEELDDEELDDELNDDELDDDGPARVDDELDESDEEER